MGLTKGEPRPERVLGICLKLGEDKRLVLSLPIIYPSLQFPDSTF